MKSDEFYSLNATMNGIRETNKKFKDELENLDPSATKELRLILAEYQGIYNFVEKKIKLYEGETK